MKKLPKLQAAILAALASSPIYADDTCLPPDAGSKSPLEVFQCFEAKLNRQQEQLGKQAAENQQLKAAVEQLTQTVTDYADAKANQAEQATKTAQIRYVDNGNGTVIDHKTGLIWLKNANCFGTQTWEKAKQSAAALAHGQCGLGDGSKAGAWHLPTVEELETIVDRRYYNPALANAAGTGKWTEGDAFSGVQNSWYWVSSTSAFRTDDAWGVLLSTGYVNHNDKTSTLYVWPVRGGQ